MKLRNSISLGIVLLGMTCSVLAVEVKSDSIESNHIYRGNVVMRLASHETPEITSAFIKTKQHETIFRGGVIVRIGKLEGLAEKLTLSKQPDGSMVIYTEKLVLSSTNKTW